MRNKGATMMELVIFILVITIAASVLIPLGTVLLHVSRIDRETQAIELAQQRMEIILQHKHAKGFGFFYDPCALTTPPAICTTLAGYNIASSIINVGSDFKEITVTTNGFGSATLKLLVAKY